MNIIELVKSLLQEFPKICEVCNEIHVDFTDSTDNSYGLSATGDTLLSEDILGNQKRQHTFILYAVYQSVNDYDRIANSGTLLELQMWLERHADNQKIAVNVGGDELTGILRKLTCANGMLYSISDGNMNSGVLYQLQITAEYTINN